jgi:secreted trypsin-like serine protease
MIMLILLTYCLEDCLAGTIDPDNNDKDYINYASEFDCVLDFRGINDKDQDFLACCVAIKPRWVVTAAHIVENIKTCYVVYKQKKYPVEKVIINSKFKAENYGQADIAICLLKEEIKLDKYPALYEEKNEKYQQCSICGHGNTGTFITGIEKYDGKKRAGTNTIDEVWKDVLMCTASKENDKTKLEFLSGKGDSGGGLFIEGKLAGITSCVFSGDDKKSNSNYGDVSCHTRVSIFADWINKHIKEQEKIKFNIEKIY